MTRSSSWILFSFCWFCKRIRVYVDDVCGAAAHFVDSRLVACSSFCLCFKDRHVWYENICLWSELCNGRVWVTSAWLRLSFAGSTTTSNLKHVDRDRNQILLKSKVDLNMQVVFLFHVQCQCLTGSNGGQAGNSSHFIFSTYCSLAMRTPPKWFWSCWCNIYPKGYAGSFSLPSPS